ncbi:lactate utilization protein C [Calditrichota bacterium]
MNSKEKTLNRLHKPEIVKSIASLPEINDSNVFADYPSAENLLDIFTQKFKSLSGELILVSDLKEAGKSINNLISQSNNKKCITHSSSLIDTLLEQNQSISSFFDKSDSKNLNSKTFSEYEIGLTATDYLVARTGSIVLRSLSAGGRRLSILPPTHIVLAERKQMVFSLDQILKSQELYLNTGSFATIITGPSRTSDIEKQLVLGAHGPKRLILIMVNK